MVNRNHLFFAALSLSIGSTASASEAIFQCPSTEEKNFFQCKHGTKCELTKNVITPEKFQWNGEPYIADIVISIDTTTCSGFAGEGEPTDIYLSADGKPLAEGKLPAEVVRLGTRHTINLRGPGPIKIFDNDPDWTKTYYAGSFCDIKISCKDVISKSTASNWLDEIDALIAQIGINRAFIEKESLLTTYYKVYLGDPNSGSALAEEAQFLIDFGDANDISLGNQIIAMLKGATQDVLFKPFTDRRNEVTKQMNQLDRWEAKLTWAKPKSQTSFEDALSRIASAKKS